MTLVPGLSWQASLQIWTDWRMSRAGHLRIDHDSIYVEFPQRPALQISRSGIRAGFRVPGTTQVILLLADGGRVTLDVQAGAADPLEALRLGVESSTLEVKLQRPGDAIALALVTGGYSLIVTSIAAAATESVWPLLISLGLTVLLWLHMAARRIVVGADGVLVRSGLRERFVGFEEVATVDDLAVTTKRGKQIKVAVSGNPVERAAAVHRLHEAFRAYCARATGALDANLLRGERSMEAWKDDLTRRARAQATFRSSAASREDLEAVLANPASRVEQRLGAAVALAFLGDEGAARVRIAAEASANQRVRVALDAAAQGTLDDDAFEEAVATEPAKDRA
jgi:hypothetical protein